MPTRNTLLHAARHLQGNARAAVWTEPMWGLSMGLVLPYASVFMLALGLRDQQIGALATIGLVVQVGFGLLGGVITDKLGRRRTTAVFDLFTWVVPCLIWAIAQNFWFFLVASVINGVLPVVHNAWDCLLIEDAERESIPRLYALVRMAAECSALFAPIAALLVANWGLVPAVRVLYLNAALIMAAKILLLYRYSTETGTGRARMAQMRGVSVTRALRGYRGVLALIVGSRGSVFSVAVAALVAAVTLVNATFWPVLVTAHLGLAPQSLPFFAMARSLLTIAFFLTVIPRLVGAADMRRSTLVGFVGYLAGQVLLVSIPASAVGTPLVYGFLAGTVLLDAFGAGILFMLSESLLSLHVNLAERSRVMAIQRLVVMLAAAPSGWIAGWLSGHNREWPFIYTAVLLLGAIIYTATHWVPPPTVPNGSARAN